MENFQPIRISRNSYSLNDFCIEPKSKLAETEIEHAQFVPKPSIWCYILQFIQTDIREKSSFFHVSAIGQCLNSHASVISLFLIRSKIELLA